MSYQSDIYDAILACEPLTDRIGERVSWDVADGTTVAPFMVLQTISPLSQTTHDGDRSVCFDLIQVSIWATGKSTALAIAAIFKTELEGRELGGESELSLSYAGGSSSYDVETKLFGESIDYRVHATIT